MLLEIFMVAHTNNCFLFLVIFFIKFLSTLPSVTCTIISCFVIHQFLHHMGELQSYSAMIEETYQRYHHIYNSSYRKAATKTTGTAPRNQFP
jgi:hypothetical protein